MKGKKVEVENRSSFPSSQLSFPGLFQFEKDPSFSTPALTLTDCSQGGPRCCPSISWRARRKEGAPGAAAAEEESGRTRTFLSFFRSQFSVFFFLFARELLSVCAKKCNSDSARLNNLTDTSEMREKREPDERRERIVPLGRKITSR